MFTFLDFPVLGFSTSGVPWVGYKSDSILFPLALGAAGRHGGKATDHLQPQAASFVYFHVTHVCRNLQNGEMWHLNRTEYWKQKVLCIVVRIFPNFLSQIPWPKGNGLLSPRAQKSHPSAVRSLSLSFKPLILQMRIPGSRKVNAWAMGMETS